jgi:ParB-like chromosome segregation protein Spo0J
MKFERKTISSRQLDLLANNPRTITKESLDRLCESIRRNGFWEHMPVAVEPVEGTDRFLIKKKRKGKPQLCFHTLTKKSR